MMQPPRLRSPRPRRTEGPGWKVWLGPALFTVVAGYAVLRGIGSVGALRRVSVDWLDLGAAAAIYPVFAAVRGLRFQALMSQPMTWRRAVGIGWMYSAATSVLPGGLGEASLPVLYRGKQGGVADATAALVTTRVQDLLSWLVILVLAGLSALHLLPRGAWIGLVLAVLLTAGAALFTFVAPVRRWVLRLCARLPLPTLAGFLDDFDRRLQPMAWDGRAWGLTFALRLLSTFKYFFALQAFGAPVTPLMAAVGGALLALVLVIPVQGIAGLGTVELSWMAALTLFGVPGTEAAVAALGTHALLLILSLACGGLALAGGGRTRLRAREVLA
ncbi:MAG TPA: lysylphosphatidylglycerol synthase transmembrane domain-containing protein [Bacillota bacterium]|nr:lysylphosphatidylglycerol synthase transmembrane domain-containing protein [Bacillota bacterium]